MGNFSKIKDTKRKWINEEILKMIYKRKRYKNAINQ